MKRLLKICLLILTLFIVISFSSCYGDTSDHKTQIKKLKVGMDQATVLKYMGEADYIDQSNQYKILYWFEGASTVEEIQAKSDKGAHLKYYCVILISDDYVNYTIREAEDIFSGYWGQD